MVPVWSVACNPSVKRSVDRNISVDRRDQGKEATIDSDFISSKEERFSNPRKT
jgi:hypothetical protein